MPKRLTIQHGIYNGLDTRVGKVDSTGTRTYKRDGAYVTDPVLSDGAAGYTPGISERRSGTTNFYHQDRLGTTERLTNTSQTTTDTRTYDAFGLLVASTGSTPTPFGFAGAHGYQEDPDSGLKLLGHRYYDPSTGRFLTRDPIKDDRNWYSYCGNNPLAAVDPDGKVWQLIVYLYFIVAEFWVAAGGGAVPGLPAPPGDRRDVPSDQNRQNEKPKPGGRGVPKPRDLVRPGGPPVRQEGGGPSVTDGGGGKPAPTGGPPTRVGLGSGSGGIVGGIVGLLLKPLAVVGLLGLPSNASAPPCSDMIHRPGRCPHCGLVVGRDGTVVGGRRR